MTSLFVAWQQPNSREWIPVARLDQDGGIFRFMYLKGIRRARGFQPFGKMDRIDAIYESKKLFPLFSNRLISKSRPEYVDYLEWLGLDKLPEDPMTMLGLTGGIRGTDSIELFPLPMIGPDGAYHIDFFVRGLRYMPKEAIDRVNSLKFGEKILLMQDKQNEVDPKALAIRSTAPINFLGYCPRYYEQDIQAALHYEAESLSLTVHKVNKEAPLNMRLLCKLSGKLPNSYSPCYTNEDFTSIEGSSLIDWEGISLSVTD